MIFTLIATAAFGLEGLVRRELTELGFDSRAENGYVRFEGTLEDAFKATLWLRTADRVLILMAEGTVMTFEDLFRLVRGCAWQELMPRDAALPRNSTKSPEQVEYPIFRRYNIRLDRKCLKKAKFQAGNKPCTTN